MSRGAPGFLTIVAFALLLASSAQAAAPFNSFWDASLGVLPDSTCPNWTPIVTDSVPRFSNGALRIHTTACNKNVLYLQTGADIALPDTVVVEARLRFETGTECIGSCGHSRQAGLLAVTVAPNVGASLTVGDDEIFLQNGQCAGITSVAVGTKDAAHTYRLVVEGGTTVRVYRDGALALTGSTYTSASDHGPTPRVVWGEGSSFAFGTTWWESVKHNMHATGCETSGVPPGGAAGAFTVRAWPNPSNDETTLVWSTARAGHAEVGIFDAAGRVVRTLREDNAAPGFHAVRWNGRDESGRRIPPGTYFGRVESGGTRSAARIVRVR